ncbi:hypothetical protein EXIGLDRAFT_762907 [Exidia glandulosa HHB12029]|uniref:Uncharacterized protein n=1 Tax=Exidia glandulosa HHB12029 TaxID=1314781 RepID=A0A165ME63_EXIGL|nr:hypothetical protein EXIGLDRAFT_762907 [Exidia glandulosa HHB12029]
MSGNASYSSWSGDLRQGQTTSYEIIGGDGAVTADFIILGQHAFETIDDPGTFDAGRFRVRVDGTSYGFDFDTVAATPELVTAAPAAQGNAIDLRLAKLEANFAKLFDAITGGNKPDASPAPAADAATPSTTPPAPHDPNSYAARASSAPTNAPKNTPAAPKAPTPQGKGGKNPPPRRYEETRAIFQLAIPLRHSERSERAKRIAADTELVNDALLEHCGASMGPRVVGLNWSENGNLVLMAMDGFTGEHLVEHSSVIVTALGITCEVKARRDTPWHKVTLARVPTYGPDGNLLTDGDVRANLHKTNPRFAQLNLVDSIAPVHWLTSEQARRTQPTASMVVCLASQEDADALLQLNNRLYVYGHTCGTRKFEERGADPLCTNCWTVKPKHRTSSCRGEPRCKFCAGAHHSDEHTCKTCQEERATSHGDEQMEDASEPLRVGPCAHIPLKCVNCGESHAANDARCPYRRKIVGSSSGAPPMSGVAQAKRQQKKGKRSPATGANATRPVERAAEVGWADPEVWPTTLPYGDDADAPTPDADANAKETTSASPAVAQGTQDEPAPATANVTQHVTSMSHKWYKKEMALSNSHAGSLSRYPYEIF